MLNTTTEIRNSRIFVAAMCTILAALTANAAPQVSPQKPASQDSRIGEIRLDNYNSLRLEPSQKPGVTIITLAGQALVITSPRYKMAAPRIQLTLKNNKVTVGAATGGVQVTVKDDAANQTTQVTCSTATYIAGGSANRGRIDLKGTVRSKTYSPGLAQPLVSESESGYIEFTGNGSPIVQLNNGSASVTLIEPTPAPKK